MRLFSPLNRSSISIVVDQSAEIEDRVEFGHWEADSVLGVRGTTNWPTSSTRSTAGPAKSSTGQPSRNTQPSWLGLTTLLLHFGFEYGMCEGTQLRVMLAP